MGLSADIRTTDANEFSMEGIDYSVLDKKVTFAFCTRGNDIYSRLVTYLLQQHHVFKHMNLVTASNQWRPSCDFLFEMVGQTNYEYAHILDTDVAPRKDTTVRLISHGVDIVSCPVWFYDGGTNSIHLNFHTDERCLREHTPRDPSEGLEKVFATSFGCVVINRRVLDTFIQTGQKFTTWSDLIDEQFKEAAPDTIFFAKAQALGFDVYMDWSCEFATHHKFVELNSRTIETFVAHRLFDRDMGVEAKREMLSSTEGRNELCNRLQRGPDAEPGGPDDADEPEAGPGEAGQTHEVSSVGGGKDFCAIEKTNG